MRHDLDDLRLGITRRRERGDIGVPDLAAFGDELDREPDRDISLGVEGRSVAIGGDFRRVELGHMRAEVCVRGKAMLAAIHLRHGECDALAGLGAEAALGERAVEPQQGRRQSRWEGKYVS